MFKLPSNWTPSWFGDKTLIDGFLIFIPINAFKYPDFIQVFWPGAGHRTLDVFSTSSCHRLILVLDRLQRPWAPRPTYCHQHRQPVFQV